MSFGQERSGEAGPDAARNDSPTTPATPPAADAEGVAPVAGISFDKEPGAPEPEAPVAEAGEAGEVGEAGDATGAAEDPAPAAISFAKQPAAPETAAPVAVGAEPVPAGTEPAPGVPADAPPAPGVPPAPVNPWALPTAPPPPAPGAVPPGAPVPPVPGPAPANPWAAAPPGAPVPPPSTPVPPGTAVPGPGGGNPWAPTGVQQPWGTGGYPPPGAPGSPVGPPMYPVPQRSLYTNNLAIASLIVGVLCCYLGFIGIGLGIAALRQIKRTGERGRALATSGIVAGSIGMVLFALSVIGGLFSSDDFDDSGSRPSTVSPAGKSGLAANSPFRLTPGQCFERVGLGNAKVVDCASAHFGEAYWTQATEEKGATYPGDDVMTAEAEKLCMDQVDTYVADTWSIPDEVSTFYFYPDRASWKDSATHRIVCFLGNHDKSSRTGALQKFSSSLTADQRQLLDATNQFDKAWAKGPDEDVEVEDDPQAYRAWAKDMSAAASRQASQLEAAHWTTADKATVDRLVAKSKAAAGHYLLASKAADNATLRRELGLADDNFGDDEIISLRRALGLATQQEEPAKHPGNQAV
ncbi:DUF4190 domain-containing protein [Kitasatospora sp. NPDC092948]|uniref:DUF4190 domain-containing protein n=1 Tax=Kitasatospora sp. NPDC092948 TaxID=3364088 RepID=UPI0037F66A53